MTFTRHDTPRRPMRILDRRPRQRNAKTPGARARGRGRSRWLAIGLWASVAPAGADYRAGLYAFEIADYAAARRAWEVCADEGDPKSQFGLGVLYNEGRGVDEDPSRAAYWFRLAARQDSADAQFELGVMRAMGRDGVAQDAVQAYVWFYLAAHNGDVPAEGRRDLVASLLLEDEKAEADRRIAAWLRGERDWLGDTSGPESSPRGAASVP